MWLNTACEFSFDIYVPTTFVLMLRPRSGASQWISREEYRLKPSVSVFEFTDSYGNLCQRLIAPPGSFAEVEITEAHPDDLVGRIVGPEGARAKLVLFLLGYDRLLRRRRRRWR